MKSLLFGDETLADSSIEFWWTPSAYYQQPMSFNVKGKAGYQKLSQAVVGMGAWYISLPYCSLSFGTAFTAVVITVSLPLSQGCWDVLLRSGSLAYDNEAQSRTAHSSWRAADRQRNPQILARPLYRCLDILLCCCHLYQLTRVACRHKFAVRAV